MNKQALGVKPAKSVGLAERWIPLKDVLTYNADVSRPNFGPEFLVNKSQEIKVEGQFLISYRSELSKEIFTFIIASGEGYLDLGGISQMESKK